MLRPAVHTACRAVPTPGRRSPLVALFCALTPSSGRRRRKPLLVASNRQGRLGASAAGGSSEAEGDEPAARRNGAEGGSVECGVQGQQGQLRQHQHQHQGRGRGCPLSRATCPPLTHPARRCLHPWPYPGNPLSPAPLAAHPRPPAAPPCAAAWGSPAPAPPPPPPLHAAARPGRSAPPGGRRCWGQGGSRGEGEGATG